jgi:uncharacterized protein YacL
MADEATLHPIDAAKRQRLLMLRVVRMAFAVLLITVAVLNSAIESTVNLAIAWWVPVGIAAVLFAVALVVDLFTPNKKISAISSVFLGILAGMLATVALGVIMDLLIHIAVEDQDALNRLKPFIGTLKVLLGITLCYLGITTVLQTQDDFRLVIPYVEFSKQIRGPKPLVLDTSTLIDARIADVGATGIIQAPIVIPRFVIAELQLLADSSDRLKRARGRRGLDVTTRLQRSLLDVTIDETPVPGKAVDQMLIELARQMPGTIVTTDTGLARVAQIQGVSVLNLNDVANSLKPALIPGEQLTLRLIKQGEQAGQGVGYLDDGTMVVCESAAHLIGDDATVMVTSTLQTSAGRLIFAKLADDAGHAHEARHEPAGGSRERDDAGATPPPPPPVALAGAPSGLPPGANGQPGAPDQVGGEHAEPGEHRAGNAAGIGAPGAVSAPEPSHRPGPFPPKPPMRKPNPARNPRR